MKGIKEFLTEGYEVKSSHSDINGQHWVILQKDKNVVIVKLPISMWSGKPSSSANEEYWEING